MPSPSETIRRIVHAPGDPIRIVPLHDPALIGAPVAGAPAQPPPHLTYRGGPLLAAAQVFTAFWGAAWSQGQTLPGLISHINGFFQYILTSSLIDQLAEYNVPAYKIGHGKYVGTATVITPTPGRSETDAALRHMLQQEIATNRAFPPPSANLLYFVYLPPGVSVVQGGARSCQAFCGYHDSISGSIFYAAMPYPGCQGCAGSLSAQDALTATSSHELCEAITDAVPGSGWYDDANGEIGDICAWNTKKLGPYTVQAEWSNANGACV